MTRSPSRSSAFTMIELLITISIIMIICSMLVAALMMLRRQQRLVSTKSLMNQVELALHDYLNTYPILGGAQDETSSDFADSPWTFLYRNRVATGQSPYLDYPIKLARGSQSGPWSPGNAANGDQILDAFPTRDYSNFLKWSIINGTTAGGTAYTYTDKIYIRSTVGTPSLPQDDLVLRYTNSDGSWQWIHYQDAEADTPAPW